MNTKPGCLITVAFLGNSILHVKSCFNLQLFFLSLVICLVCIFDILKTLQGPSWSWSYCSWIYNYLCNQCLSSLTLRVRIPLKRGVLDTTICDKVCHWLATGRWFSPGIPVSSILYSWSEIVYSQMSLHFLVVNIFKGDYSIAEITDVLKISLGRRLLL
jgi:hypothetical protein